MGAFAQPLDSDHFWILAWAWGEWGEMSFFIAGVAATEIKSGRIISKDTHNAICLAVLVSMLVCPAGLRRKLEEYEKKAKYQIAEACTRVSLSRLRGPNSDTISEGYTRPSMESNTSPRPQQTSN